MTAKEIASLCGVSTATVSNILNGKGKASEATVKKVMEVIEANNYKPNPIARGLRTKVSKTIGVIAEDVAQFTTPDILEGIMEECEKAGYRVMVENLRCYSRWGDKWYGEQEELQKVIALSMSDMRSVQVDGMIYIAGHAREIRGFSEKLDIPNVVAYAYSYSQNSASVMIDDVKGGYDMTKYLLDKGHRKIAFIGGREDNLHTVRRLEGYQKALFEYKVLYNPELVSFGNWERPSGYDCMKKLEGTDFTAVFCINDQMCGGVYDYLSEKRLTAGKDISVTGFDDMIIASYFRPGLTTNAINLKEIGRVSAKKLIEVFKTGKDFEEKVTYVPCKLVERESVTEINR